jgi:hypothetical protein
MPVQSTPIITNVVGSYPVHLQVYSIQHYVIKFVSDLRMSVISPGTPVPSPNKADPHDITGILLKVVFNTITLTFVQRISYLNLT